MKVVEAWAQAFSAKKLNGNFKIRELKNYDLRNLPGTPLFYFSARKWKNPFSQH
jgi:hypothetical protein